ncbi:MAG TPA: ATP-binding protein, partial [Pyrinomonadaceae bacterium]|nr:ATP-binding protein [Pyrinomonadaceae bacterium]
MSSTPWPAVPYHVGGAVSDDLRFADRKELLYTLRTLAADPDREGFILSGPRRYGKSSVLERFARIIGTEACVVRLNVLAILGYADVWPAGTVVPTMLRTLLDVLEADLGTLPSRCRELAEYPRFEVEKFRREALPDLISLVAPRRLVVLIDEMEVAQELDLMAPVELVSALLPLPGSRGLKTFLGIIWGRPFGRGLSRNVPSRLKDFHRKELKRFTASEVGEALRQPVHGAYDWSEETIERVWKLTVGHPLFVASVGAAVHARRYAGVTENVSVAEVDAALKDALGHAESWEDAWGQLNIRQQILLRAIAEEPGANIDRVVSIAQGWNAPYDRADFEPFTRSLHDDGLIAEGDSGFVFQVPMIRSWIHRFTPTQILNAPENPRDGFVAEAVRKEQEGRRLYEAGQLNEAALAFQAALELDATRWWAAA